MTYYQDRKQVMQDIQEWAYNANREPWNDFVAKMGREYGFGERSLISILTQMSAGKLEINNKGELHKKKTEEAT